MTQRSQYFFPCITHEASPEEVCTTMRDNKKEAHQVGSKSRVDEHK